MYGLFLNTYDYYEWHDLVAVSAVRESLIRLTEGEPYPLLDGKEQKSAANSEIFHYVIKEVKEV